MVKKKHCQKPTPRCDAVFNEIKTNLGYALEELFLFGCSQEEIQQIEKKTKWKRIIRKIGLGK